MLTFFRYFFHYIVHAKTRQRLLFLAFAGMVLSSFALLSIQGIMGGLQTQLIGRWKSVHGEFSVTFNQLEKESLNPFLQRLNDLKTRYSLEYEIEMLLKNGSYLAPVKLHGLMVADQLPDFLLEKDFSGLILGSDLSYRLKAKFLDELVLLSPSHTDSLMGDVPRFMSVSLSDYLVTELAEVDGFEGWIQDHKLHNLLRERTYNRIRFYSPLTPELTLLLKEFPQYRYVSWDEEHQTLSGALKLETRVMLFLFVSMGLLVSVTIVSGWLIFYNKITRDFLTFWILGMESQKIFRQSYLFTVLVSFLSGLLGLILGICTLKMLELMGHRLMPDVFMERRLPVSYGAFEISLSFLLPFAISMIFSYLAFRQFKRTHHSMVQSLREIC